MQSKSVQTANIFREFPIILVALFARTHIWALYNILLTSCHMVYPKYKSSRKSKLDIHIGEEPNLGISLTGWDSYCDVTFSQKHHM